MRASFGFLSLLTLAACAREWREPPPVDEVTYRADYEVWRTRRASGLLSDDAGWLLLVGLYELAEGTNRFGADSTLPIVLPSDRAPPRAGTLVREGTRARLEPEPGVRIELRGGALAGPVALRTDAVDSPTVFALGSLRMKVIERFGGRLYLRVWDVDHPAKRTFTGVPAYPLEPRWRLAARYEKFRRPRTVRVLDVTGANQEFRSPGRLAFRAGGRDYRLTAVLESPDATDLWALFGDSTNATTTYGAGRYLHVPLPDSSGWTVIDFNRTYNPPCAFTAFATCPLPPRENRLALSVTAGEQRYR